MSIFFRKGTVNSNFATPTGITAADLDQDGDVEIIAVSSGYGDDDLIWHKNNGNSTINTTKVDVTGGLGGDRNAVYAADIDQDGDIDLVTAENGDDDVTIFYNTNGRGTSWSSNRIADSARGATKIFVGNFGTDGFPDIAVVTEDDDDVRIWRQTSRGNFSSITLDGSLNEARAIFGADFDRDGDLDVVAAGDNELFWYRNNGGGNSWTAISISTSYNVWDVVAADIDQDGDQDIIIAADNGVRYWRNNGSGSFSGLTTVVSFRVYQLDAEDIDQDGDIDLVFGEGNSDSGDVLYWYSNNGNGSFTAYTIDTGLDGITAVYAGDINNDGFPDVLAGTEGEDDIYWYRNELRKVSVTAGINPIEGVSNGTFTITLDEADFTTRTVNYTISGTATNNTDYTLSGNAVFSTGQTSKTITIAPINDVNYDPNETVIITLTGNGISNNYIVDSSNSSATLTIQDITPVVSISSTGLVNPVEGGATGQFTISLNTTATTAFTLAYSLTGASGDVILDDDNNLSNGNLGTGASGTISIGENQSSKTIYVFANDDFIYDPGETVEVTVLPSSSSTTVNNIAVTNTYRVDLSKNSTTLTVLDNEPVVSVSSVESLTEGSSTGEFIGYVDLSLSADVTNSSGLRVYYEVTGGTATQFTDYLNSQGRLNSSSSAENVVYVPPGANSARLYLSALPDAIAESTETVTITLLTDSSTAPTYGLGNSKSATVNITDSGHYIAGFAILDAYGKAVTANNPLVANASGQVQYTVKLTSQPTANVTVNVGSNALTFTPSNWDDSQIINLSNVTSNQSLAVSTMSTDNGYSGLAGNITVRPNNGVPVLQSTEGQTGTPTITPTVSLSLSTNANEGEQTPGIYLVTLSEPAPSGGLTVNYTVAGTANSEIDYTTLSGSVAIASGETSAQIAVQVLDDDFVESAETVVVTLQSGTGYIVNDATAIATLTLSDADTAGLNFASPQTIGSLTTASDLLKVGVLAVDDQTVSLSVNLQTQPTAPVTVTFNDGLTSSADSKTLTFTTQNWNSAQNVVLVDLATNSTADFTYQIQAVTSSTDTVYNNQAIALPIATNILDTGIASLLTTEGDNTILRVRLTSKPTANVTLSFDDATIDATENSFSVNTLNFNGDNWNTYQEITVTGLTDNRADGDITYSVTVTASSSDGNYNGLYELLPITNRDIDSDVIDSNALPDDNLTTDPLATVTITGSSRIIEDSGVPGQFVISVGEGSSGNPVTVRYGALTGPEAGNAATEGVDYQPFSLFNQQVGADNPLNSADVDSYSAPAFVDLDNDGDRDALIGTYYGTIDYYKNTSVETTGSIGAPTFSLQSTGNPLAGIDLNGTTSPGYSAPTFGDIDADGDYDLFLGSSDGKIRFYQNTGTPITPSFTEKTGTANPLSSVDVGSYSTPVLVDIDADGDLDLFTGTAEGTIKFFRNIGNENSPEFIEGTGSDNIFDGVDVGDRSAITFGDVDDDGDFDAIIGGDVSVSNGTSGGVIQYWLNTGTISNPVFVQDDDILSRSSTIEVPDHGMPTLANIDGDTDPDLLIGNLAGTIDFYENLASGEVSIFPGQSATLNLTPYADNIAEGDETITVVLNTNQGYQIGENNTATFTIADNDTVGVEITDSSGASIAGKTYTTSETSQNVLTFSAQLTSQPTDTVTLYLGSNNTEEGLLSSDLQINQEVVSLYFTPDTWNIPQTFNLTSQDDQSDDGTVGYEIITTVVSGDRLYDKLEVSDIRVQNQDNDNAAIQVKQISDSTQEGGLSTYQVYLSTKPLAEVNITMTPSDGEIQFSGNRPGLSQTLTFNDSNWSIPQTVTVLAVADNQVEYTHSSEINFTVASLDSNYADLTPPATITVNIVDDDLPIARIETSQNAAEEATPGYFTIFLSDAADSSVGATGLEVGYQVLTTSTATNGSDYQTIVQSGTVRIAPGQNSTSLTVFGIDDFLIDNESVTVELIPRPGYTLGEQTSSSLTIVDNDLPGLKVIQAGNIPVVKEGETNTFYVSLLSEPTSNVTVNFSSNAQLGTIASKTFTPDNWSILQPVTMAGVDENVAETGETHSTTITYSFTTDDSDYANLTVTPQTVNIIDRSFNSVNTALGLEYSLDAIATSLTESSLPLIGTASSLPNFFELITDSLSSAVRTTTNLTAWKLDQIFRNILSQVGDSISNLEINYTPTSNDTAFIVSFRTTYNDVTIPLSQDLGIPTLGLEVTAEALTDVGYDFTLAFGIDKTTGYYLNTTDTVLNPFVTIKDVDLTEIGSLNSLSLEFGDSELGLDLDYEITIGGDDPTLDTEQLKSFNLRPIQEFFGDINYNFKPGSFAKLLLSASLDDRITDLFPELGFDLAIADMPLFNYADHTASAATDFSLELLNVVLDVQSLVTGYVKKYVGIIDDILQPIYPIIDALNADTKFLSTLELDPLFDNNNDSKVSVMELVLELLNVEETNGDNETLQNLGFDGFDDGSKLDFYEFIDAVNELIEIVRVVNEYVADDSNLIIVIGDLNIDLKAAAENGSINFDLANLLPTGNVIDRILSSPLVSDQLKTVIERIFDIDGLAIPLLTDFTSVAQLLLGQEEVDFLIYDMPDLDFDINVDLTEIGLAGILPDFGLNAVLEIDMGLNSNIYLAYDNHGLALWKEANFDSSQADLLLDGLYLRDVNSQGRDTNELGASFGIGIGFEANAIVAKAKMTGGVQTDNDVKIDFIDGGEYTGNSDGKVRYSELSPLFSGNLSGLDLSGAIEAFLNAEVKVGVDLGLIEVMETVLDIDIATFELWDEAKLQKELGIGGKASQSYLQGGTVFFDANFNGLLDVGEVSTITEDDGSFNLNVGLIPYDRNRNGKIDQVDGRLVVVNGVDSSTGMPTSTPLFAPFDSAMITPLTSLLQKLKEEGVDLAQAATRIKSELDLPDSINLQQFDALLAIENGDANGAKVYTAHVVIQSMIAMLTQFMSGVTGQSPAEVTDQVTQAIALAIFNDSLDFQADDLSWVKTYLVSPLFNADLPDVENVLSRAIAMGIKAIRRVSENTELSAVVNTLIPLKTAVQFDLGNLLRQLGASLVAAEEADRLLNNWQSRIQQLADVPVLLSLVLAVETEAVAINTANLRVLTALGLPDNLDLNSYNPGTDAVSQQVLNLENQLTLLYQLGGQLLQGAGISDADEAAWLITRATAQLLEPNDPVLNLRDSQTIADIIQGAAVLGRITEVSLSQVAQITEQRSDRISSLNSILDILSTASPNEQIQVLDAALASSHPSHIPLPLVIREDNLETVFLPDVVDTQFQLWALSVPGEYELGVKTADGRSLILLQNQAGANNSPLTTTLDSVSLDTLTSSEKQFFGSLVASPSALSSLTGTGLEFYLKIGTQTYTSQAADQFQISSKGSQGLELSFNDNGNSLAKFALATPVLLSPGLDPSTTTSATVTIGRGASYTNTIGLYEVDDLTGAIGLLQPGETGYAAAALQRAQASGLILNTPDDFTVGTDTLNLPSASNFGLFLIANATVEQFLDSNPENLANGKIHSFFSYGAANPDQRQHITPLGDNLFGFEDLFGGGDNDFNDALLQVQF